VRLADPNGTSAEEGKKIDIEEVTVKAAPDTAIYRAEAGKMLVEMDKEKENRVKYDQGKREIGVDVEFSDCSATATTILQLAGQGQLFESNYTGSGGGGGIQGEIMKKSGFEGIKEAYRKENPKIGDIMMWEGHIGIVTDVTDEKMEWANMGSKTRLGIRSADLNNLEAGAQVYSENFWGFWTPEEFLEPEDFFKSDELSEDLKIFELELEQELELETVSSQGVSDEDSLLEKKEATSTNSLLDAVRDIISDFKWKLNQLFYPRNLIPIN
jgi:hypothetical protein